MKSPVEAEFKAEFKAEFAAEIEVEVDVDACCWPDARLGEAIEELARRTGLAPASKLPPGPPCLDGDGSAADPARWIDWTARRLGIESEPLATPASGFTDLITGAGPALLRAGHPVPGIFLLLPSAGRTVRLLGPDLRIRRCRADALRDALCAPFEAGFSGEVDRLLQTAQVAPARRPQVRAALLRERLGARQIGQCWLLRAAPTGSFWKHLMRAGLRRKVALILGGFAMMFGLEIAGWGLIGRITLDGRLDPGWLTAWGLLVLTLIPLRLLVGWLNASIGLDTGRLLKTRLLAGALRLDPELVRRLGAGQLLGRVMESQALESLALNGTMALLMAILELLFAILVLASGDGALLHLALLAAWLLLTLGLSWRYFNCLRHWTGMRVAMTHELVERMVGHRTTLAQEQSALRSAREDQEMNAYLNASKAMDHAILPAAGIMPRGWMLLGLIGLAPAFITGTSSALGLAIGLGGMLLANRALGGISGGLAAISRAAIAWEQVGPIFRAAQRPDQSHPFLQAGQRDQAVVAGSGRIMVDARGLGFRYREDGPAVLQNLEMVIEHGDRILLQGPSGGGKSSLAAVLVGLAESHAGSLLFNGLDRATLGDAWRELATEAPQFHENHIFSGSLAFNLLMGKNWPATDLQLREARDLCEELGLGELLKKMPSGIMQMVGETGWQLSHGERGRIFLARALLQDAQFTILDESFAALDPQTLERCLACVLRRARTLMVIAHP